MSEETWTDWICGDPGATFGVDSGPRAEHAPRPLLAAAGASIHALGLHLHFLQVLPRLHPIFLGVSFMPQVVSAARTLPLATLSPPVGLQHSRYLITRACPTLEPSGTHSVCEATHLGHSSTKARQAWTSPSHLGGKGKNQCRAGLSWSQVQG